MQRKLENLSRKLDSMTDRMTMALIVSGAGIWEYKFPSDGREGKMIWDHGMMELFKPQYFSGKYSDFTDALIPEDSKTAQILIDDAVENRSLYDFTYTLKNGVIIRSIGKATYNMEIPISILGVCIEAHHCKTCPISPFKMASKNYTTEEIKNYTPVIK